MTTPTIDVITNKLAITEVLARYCRAVDRLDRNLALSVWHPDGTANYLGIFTGTGSAFIDFCFTAHLTYSAHSHQVTNAIITLDGESAASEAYVTARLRSIPKLGVAFDTIVCGRYIDRWSCRRGAWAIDHRIFVTDIHSVLEVASGVEPPESRRDTTDPSYQWMNING